MMGCRLKSVVDFARWFSVCGGSSIIKGPIGRFFLLDLSACPDCIPDAEGRQLCLLSKAPRPLDGSVLGSRSEGNGPKIDGENKKKRRRRLRRLT